MLCSCCAYTADLNFILKFERHALYKLIFHVPSYESIVDTIQPDRWFPFTYMHAFPYVCKKVYIIAGLIQRNWRRYIARKHYLTALHLKRIHEETRSPITKLNPDIMNHIYSYLIRFHDAKK